MTEEYRNLTHGIQPVEVFWDTIEYERARADRNFGDFSLIVFKFQDEAILLAKKDRIVRFILQRKRKIDRVGWIDSRRMGILLAHTPKAGAEKLVLDLSSKFDREGFDIVVSLHAYPSDWVLEFNRHVDDDDSQPPASRIADGHASPNEHHGNSPDLLTNLLYSIYPKHLPWWKRSFDLIVAVLLLIFSLPLMILVGLFIKAVSPGPIFYNQERIGYLGRPFRLFKFRTMHVDSQTDKHRDYVASLIKSERSMTKLDDAADSRIIPIGRWLRSFGIDELPQIFNVLRGEMSLIGPRPALGYEIREYFPWQRRRLEAVPGLTGLWQVNGKNETTFQEMIRFDLSYSRRMSFWLDSRIMLKTVPAILHQGFKSILKRKEHGYAKND